MPPPQGLQAAKTKNYVQRRSKAKWVAYPDMLNYCEFDIMQEWVQSFVAVTDFHTKVGRWRPLRKTRIDPGNSLEKQEGFLTLNSGRWDLYFFRHDDFDHNVMSERLMVHPLVTRCDYKPLNDPGTYKLVRGHQRRCPDDPFSPKDIVLRTSHNCGCLAGYTKDGDGKLTSCGNQMTSAWLKITHGRVGHNDGGQYNLEMVANMLAEICGYDFPFPEQFEDAGQPLNRRRRVFHRHKPPTTSAVGDVASSNNHAPASSSNQAPAEIVPRPVHPRVLRQQLSQSCPQPPPPHSTSLAGIAEHAAVGASEATEETEGGHPRLLASNEHSSVEPRTYQEILQCHSSGKAFSPPPVVVANFGYMGIFRPIGSYSDVILPGHPGAKDTLALRCKSIPVRLFGEMGFFTSIEDYSDEILPCHPDAKDTLALRCKDIPVRLYGEMGVFRHISYDMLPCHPDARATTPTSMGTPVGIPGPPGLPAPVRRVVEPLQISSGAAIPQEELPGWQAVGDLDYKGLPDVPHEVGRPVFPGPANPLVPHGGVALPRGPLGLMAVGTGLVAAVLVGTTDMLHQLGSTPTQTSTSTERPGGSGAGTPPPLAFRPPPATNPRGSTSATAEPPGTVAVGTSFPLDATEEVHSLPELANTGNEDEVWDTDSEDVLCENFDRLMAKAAVTEERITSVQGSFDRICGCYFRCHHHVLAERRGVFAENCKPPLCAGGSTPPPPACKPPPPTTRRESAPVAVGTKIRPGPVRNIFIFNVQDGGFVETGSWKRVLDTEPNGAIVCTRRIKAGSPTTDGPDWARANWSRMDELSDLIPDATFVIETYLVIDNQNLGYGKNGTWKTSMHDRATGYRKWVEHRVKTDCMSDGESDGRWRLMQNLVVYSMPWRRYSSDDVFSEYRDKSLPLKEYARDLINSFEGEVALAWQHWEFSPDPLPREAILWDPQHASSKQNYEVLSSLVTYTDQWGKNMIADWVDLTKVGNTTILRSRDGVSGHWHLIGGAITLPELMYTFGEKYTVAELMTWYYNAPKVLRKRDHAWGTPEKGRKTFG